MKLEQQVVSLELAKRLKELGVKQESIWAWHQGSMKPFIWLSHTFDKTECPPESSFPFMCAAFTVAELGEMLPTTTENWQNAKYADGRWFITDHGNTLRAAEAETEADARAKMLIYLIENKLITLPDTTQDV